MTVRLVLVLALVFLCSCAQVKLEREKHFDLPDSLVKDRLKEIRK